MELINKNKIKVVFFSAECAPFAKAGGLADVVGSLPPALAKLGIQPAVFLPLNRNINLRKWRAKKGRTLSVKYENQNQKVEIHKTNIPGSQAAVYFLSNGKYFDKEDVYGGKLKKFLFYNLAGLEAMKALKWRPDVIHCHDHQTGMVANILNSVYRNDKFFAGVKVMFTIHNLDYQGRQKPEILKSIDSDIDKLAAVVNDLKDGDVNFMVQGILGADILTTVSPTYAREILTKEFGCGLENVLRKQAGKLRGILNGIDIDFFNPQTDKNIKKRYSPDSLEIKAVNKFWLQKKIGLPADKNIPLVGFVSRLAWQKGVELLSEELVSELNCQFVVLGTGEKRYEEYLRKISAKYPQKFSARIMFDAGLAQQIYAASDIFLVPSRYEPCGLTQMIAMRYGAVPVVRSVGGLKDTVNSRLGVTFKKFDCHELKKALEKALLLYYKKPRQWRRFQIRGMKKDFSWDKSAKEYVKLYKTLNK